MPHKDIEERRKYYREYQKKRRERDIERAREYARNWYAENRDKARESARTSYANHRERQVARVVEGNKRRRRLLRLKAIEHYGGCCQCCSEGRVQFLAIDHINGKGNWHRKTAVGNRTIAEWLHKNGYPEGFRILCHNCNGSIGFYGFCPHQIERGEITEIEAMERELALYDRTTTTPDP
jgi:hypothetical protein